MRFKAIIGAAAAALIAGSIAALAGNTIFFTSIGDLNFPFTAPTKSAPGSIDNTVIGATTPQSGAFSFLVRGQGAPDAEIGTVTLSAAAVSNGIINGTPVAAAAYTLPLATAMDTALPTVSSNESIDFSVINTSAGANTITMTTNTGWTLVGTMTLAQNVSGRFRARKTGVGTWTLYRLS